MMNLSKMANILKEAAENQGTKYVVRLYRSECTMGTKENWLNLPKDHGVIFGTEDPQPMMNANDHEAGQHVIHCGQCTSNSNPKNIAKNFLKSLIPWPASLLVNSVEKLLGCEGSKCTPMTFTPWINVKDTHLIEGAPALTMKSKLPCFYGGVISILPPLKPEENAEQQEGEGEQEAPQNLTRAQQIKAQVAEQMAAKSEGLLTKMGLVSPEGAAAASVAMSAVSGAEGGVTGAVQAASKALMSGAGMEGASNTFTAGKGAGQGTPSKSNGGSKGTASASKGGGVGQATPASMTNLNALGKMDDTTDSLLSGDVTEEKVEQLAGLTFAALAGGGPAAQMTVGMLQASGLGNTVKYMADFMAFGIREDLKMQGKLI